MSEPIKRYTPLRTYTPLRRRTKLRTVSGHETAQVKLEIQALLRQIVIIRDGGCILRHYKAEAGSCGGYRKDGQLVLQAEHLHTRSNAASFADLRLVVCICKRHHIFFKKQHPDVYYKLVKRHIGTERTVLLERVQQDRTPHKVDFKLELMVLQQELKKLSTGEHSLNGERSV